MKHSSPGTPEWSSPPMDSNPMFVQDTSTSGVVHGDVPIQRAICGMDQAPAHQGGTNTGRQALPPGHAESGSPAPRPSRCGPNPPRPTR